MEDEGVDVEGACVDEAGVAGAVEDEGATGLEGEEDGEGEGGLMGVSGEAWALDVELDGGVCGAAVTSAEEDVDEDVDEEGAGDVTEDWDGGEGGAELVW